MARSKTTSEEQPKDHELHINPHLKRIGFQIFKLSPKMPSLPTKDTNMDQTIVSLLLCFELLLSHGRRGQAACGAQIQGVSSFLINSHPDCYVACSSRAIQSVKKRKSFF